MTSTSPAPGSKTPDFDRFLVEGFPLPSHNLATVTDVRDRPAARVADEPAEAPSLWGDVTAVLLGIVMTMCACGYEFGHGDHNSYFQEAIHTAFPKLLAHDWYTTQTLSYHSAFTWVTAQLMRRHVATPAFLVIYLGLVTTLHLAWLAIVRSVGGSRTAYVASVMFWLMIAAGRSLAGYHILQDSEVLAANFSSVAMLVGFAFWMRGRTGWAGLFLGVSGLFHLNYAVAALAGWFVLVASQILTGEAPRARPGLRVHWRRFATGTAFVLVGSLSNILHALPAALGQKHGMPFADFLNVYVHFRHPHHYDPRSWTWDRWAEFAWTIFPAVAIGVIWLRRTAPASTALARREAIRIYLGLAAAVAFGLVFAGLFFVSPTLVQLSLSRFAVYLHLFGCTALALLICDFVRMPRLLRWTLLALIGVGVSSWMFGSLAYDYLQIPSAPDARDFLRNYFDARAGLALLSFAPLVLMAMDRARRRPAWLYPLAAVVLLALLGTKRNDWHGEFDNSDHRPTDLELCAWVKDPRHTPIDAVFLTSPAEQVFSTHAERAVVVSWKCPPQLSNELPAWRDRMIDVMNIPSLNELIPLQSTIFEAMDGRFDALSVEQVKHVAAKYGATYALLHHELPADAFGKPVYSSAAGPYYLYRMAASGATRP